MSDNKKLNQINLRPSAASISIYANMAYTHWGALGEFVDNSVQSYLTNQRKIQKEQGRSKLTIKINTSTDDGGYITIKDDAGGIADKDIVRSFEIGTPPDDNTKLNEFGMGMKVASTWYAKYWSIKTKTSEDNVVKLIEVDVNKITRTNDANIVIEKFTKNNNISFTEIKLEKLNHKPQAGQTTGKIKTYLASMYRMYIREGKVDIFFNNEKLTFTEIEYLNDPREEDMENSKPKKYDWKKNISFHYKNLNFKGFAGLRLVGSTSDAGFHLFRRGRMIETTINTFRPEEIFDKSNSFPYQRIYGEVHIDETVKVDFTKTRLLWNDATRQEFITKLKEELMRGPLNLIYKAKNHRSNKTRPQNFNQKNKLGLENASRKIAKASDAISTLPISDKLSSKLIKTNKKDYSIVNTVDICGVKWSVQIISKKDPTIIDWLTVNEDKKKKKVQIIINIDHAFSQRYFPDDAVEIEGIYIIAQAIVTAEMTARKLNQENPSFVRKALNKQLLDTSKIT